MELRQLRYAVAVAVAVAEELPPRGGRFQMRMEVRSMSPTNRTAGLFGARAQARALEAWRGAAQLVWTRWQTFVEAEAETRAWAFAAYVSALDEESAAAADLAGRRLARAA